MTTATMTDTETARLAIQGEFTIYTAGEWRDRLMSLPSAAARIELDLADVSEIDTAGLQLLLAGRQEWAQSGRQLALPGASACVRDLLAYCRLDYLFAVEAKTDLPEIPS